MPTHTYAYRHKYLVYYVIHTHTHSDVRIHDTLLHSLKTIKIPNANFIRYTHTQAYNTFYTYNNTFDYTVIEIFMIRFFVCVK